MADDLDEAAMAVPPVVAKRRRTKKEMREQVGQASRLRRFLSLSVELQEGALDYAERLKKAYLSKNY